MTLVRRIRPRANSIIRWIHDDMKALKGQKILQPVGVSNGRVGPDSGPTRPIHHNLIVIF